MTAADDLEKIMVDHISIVICRQMLADEWRKVPDSNIPGRHANYMVTEIEAGRMDKSPPMLALIKAIEK